MNKPEYSVIIPVFKRKQLSIIAVRSVLNQKKINNKIIEIIIVDDEKNIKVTTKNEIFYRSISPTITYIKNKFEEGPGGARQTGFAVAKGKYITYLDSDDILGENYLYKMSKVFRKDNKLLGAIAFSDSIFDKGFSLKERIKLIPLITIRDLSLIAMYLVNNRYLTPTAFYLCQISHMMFSKSRLKGLKFNYDYRWGGEDWDFIVQILQKGKIEIIPQKLLIFRYTPKSLINQKLSRENKWNSYKLLINRLPLNFKKGLFFKLFLMYIKIFEGKNKNNLNNNKRWDLKAKSTITKTKLFLANLSIVVRGDQYRVFEKNLNPIKKSRVLDVGVTSDETIKDSNLFERIYPYPSSLVAATIEDPKKIRKLYPLLKSVVKIRPHIRLPFNDKSFDFVVSWATLEHVGSSEDQKFFLRELKRVGKKVFLTTPYRGCIYEPHSGFFFLHWLPLNTFRKICSFWGKPFWAMESNLNPLYVKDVQKINHGKSLNIKIYRMFGLLPSHLLIYSKKSSLRV